MRGDSRSLQAFSSPITSLSGREAGIVGPALIEEVSGAVRTSGRRERGDRVNDKVNARCLPSLFGATACGCHARIIAPLCARTDSSDCVGPTFEGPLCFRYARLRLLH